MVRLGYFSGCSMASMQGVPVQHVHVQVVGALGRSSRPEWPPGCPSRSLSVLAQSLGNDGEGVGDAVLAVRSDRGAWPPSSGEARAPLLVPAVTWGWRRGPGALPCLRPSGVVPVFLPYITLEVMVKDGQGVLGARRYRRVLFQFLDRTSRTARTAHRHPPGRRRCRIWGNPPRSQSPPTSPVSVPDRP